MRKQLNFLLFHLLILLLWSCEEAAKENTVEVKYENTLDEDLSGKTGSIDDYFYNFENDVNAEFFRYNPSLMRNYNTYSDYYNLFGEDPPTMSYRTFPNHLLSMTAEDEDEFTFREPIPELTVIDSVVQDSVQMTSTPFKNLESLEWNLEAEPSLQRYKLVNSDWILSDTMLYYNDTFNINYYKAIVDTPFIDQACYLSTPQFGRIQTIYFLQTIKFVSLIHLNLIASN